MAENASDVVRFEDHNPLTGELEIVVGIAILPKFTRAQFNAIRTAGLSTGWTGVRDTINGYKSGAGPVLDRFTEVPGDSAATAKNRDAYVWQFTRQGEIP